MCGIAGCFGKKDEELINRMLDAMTHRGPNDRGIFSDNNSTLGHTRLSIVDVATGHQPIVTDDRSQAIVANGEIYNFQDVKNSFSRKHKFHTVSDTEVVLHLFQEKGPAAIDNLDGMFAFAIKDRGSYLIARDPIGIKPLYYGIYNGCFYFSSELCLTIF